MKEEGRGFVFVLPSSFSPLTVTSSRKHLIFLGFPQMKGWSEREDRTTGAWTKYNKYIVRAFFLYGDLAQ